MKKIFLLFILLSFGMAKAQTWCPAGAAWHYSVTYFQSAGFQYFHYDADTVIEGITCKTINGTQYLSTPQGDTTITSAATVYTYESGDTVYTYDTAFYPVFYFNAHAGDTIYTRHVGSLDQSVVDSNGTVVINGDTLRYYVFHYLGNCGSNPNISFKVIERIGCLQTSLIPTWTCTNTDPYYYNFCNYTDSSFAVYPDSSNYCTRLYSPTSFTYHHLLDTVNIWHYASFIMGMLPPPSGQNGNARSISTCGINSARGIVYTSANVTIGSHSYLQLLVKDPLNYYFSDSCLLGYIREDTLHGKVYFLNPLDTVEFLLYDFSLQPGDSFSVNMSNNSTTGYWQSGLYKLDFIDSFTTAAGVRARYNLSCQNCADSHELIWIEGLGNLGDVIYPNSQNYSLGNFGFGNCPGYQYGFQQWVTCFEHQQKVYFDSCEYAAVLPYSQPGNIWHIIDSCDYYGGGGGIQKLSSLSSFNTYPNPTANQVTVQLNVEQNASFNIYLRNLEGKLLENHLDLGRLNPGQHSASLNLNGLSPGFYLVECRTEAGSLYSKVVVQ